MYICRHSTYIYMFILYVCTNAQCLPYIHRYDIKICTCILAYIHIHVHIHTTCIPPYTYKMYVYAHACIYISTHIIDISMYYTYVQTLDPHHIILINVSVCIYIYIYAHKHKKKLDKFIVYKCIKMHTNILYINIYKQSMPTTPHTVQKCIQLYDI